MRIEKNSKRRPRSSKSRSHQRPKGTTRLGDELFNGLREAASHFRGEIRLRSYEYQVPERINIRALRRRSGLSQAEFAGRYALNPRTVQEWEQGRSEPDLAVRAYLTVIERDPDAVQRALAGQ